MVAIGPLVLHNDERYFQNPEQCDPRRFLNVDEPNEAYYPFLEVRIPVLEKFFASYLFKNVIYKLVSNIDEISSTEPLIINPAPIPFQKRRKNTIYNKKEKNK